MNNSHFARMDIYSPVQMASLSRTQEKQELQQLNDRFAAYVQRVRVLAEKNGQVDSTAILKSTKAMEMEIHNLKNMYELELDKLRKELESCNHERTTHQVQANKQMQYASELQDRLNVETDKNAKLQDEINNYQRRISSLDAEIQDLRIAASRPHADLEQLQRNSANLTREIETWKHRYEHEQVARQEAESRIQQLMQKSDFNEKVSVKRMGELNSRIEMSAATILSLEAKVRDLSKADVSVTELLKQVRDTAEAELRKYQMESEEQYNKNLTALKAQLDKDSKMMEKLEVERTQLRGSVGELQARIRTLEGQVANLEHQKQTLEDAMAMERNRAADGVRSLEGKLREMQEMLVTKMREVTSAREQNIPLKAEIEALKALLEEEEKRLRMSLATSTTSTSAAVLATDSLSNYNATSTVASNAPYSALTNTSTSALPLSSSNIMQSSSVPGYSTYLPHAPQTTVSFSEEHRPYIPSPPLSITYIPESLQMQPTGTSIDAMFAYPQYEDELDPQLFGYSGSMPLSKYICENSPGLNRVAVEPSPPSTPRATGSSRAKSAPDQRQLATTDKKAERQRNLNLVRSDLGQGHDYFDKMFHDLQQDTLYSQGRPRSGQNERPSSSVIHDYTVSTSRVEGYPSLPSCSWDIYGSSTGDVKIAEVQQEGRYIRLVNEGTQEVEFGGFMIQQNVGGHPVAVFRFPPRTKFAPNSLITVYAGCNDRKLHQPPQDFVWKEQQKWGSGPECTTILCRPNGQAVAWTTAAHRFTRDAFQEDHKECDKNENRGVTIVEEKSGEEIADDDSLADGNTSGNANRTEPPIGLRREKQQPPSLQASGNVYSNGAAQSQDSYQAMQSACPDLLPVQKSGSSSQRKYVSGVSTHQHSVIRGTGKSGDAEEMAQEPSPFMTPHTRFQSGLDQVQSQQVPHFLPPMPRPPLFSAW